MEAKGGAWPSPSVITPQITKDRPHNKGGLTGYQPLGVCVPAADLKSAGHYGDITEEHLLDCSPTRGQECVMGGTSWKIKQKTPKEAWWAGGGGGACWAGGGACWAGGGGGACW
ncbi:hypothetical protein EYF80_046492 [Liparis tanakae]|uniref:Uncharacterized protein n=1 Tax=Liparis tanakae TaxID=230148 RepID=A0A4Z2FPZ3_9TELE|nr:hypothetical protein EYF80_046492 [Liparis tanakae]